LGPLFFDSVFLPFLFPLPRCPLTPFGGPFLALLGPPLGLFSRASIGHLFGLFPGPHVAPFRSPRCFHCGPDYFIPSSLPLFIFPSPGPPKLPLGPFSEPPWCPLWDSIPSFLRMLFRSLPGTPGALFWAPLFDLVFLSPFFFSLLALTPFGPLSGPPDPL
jgi:hypothetical protein